MPKFQRIMVDGGFTCPNRDGTVGSGGCSYCRNDSFAPDYCRKTKSITEQLEAGKRFFGQKYKDMQYIAYFQSYSCTYAPIDVLRQKYEEALSAGVKGLVIGTRPDCLQEEVPDLLEEFKARTQLKIEIGVESCHDHVLQRINRGHTYVQAEDAIRRTSARGIKVGAHIVLGQANVTPRSIVTCHCKGSLISGKVFDNLFERGCPEAFSVNDLIEDFQMALCNMHIGDHWEVYIPWQKGYGKRSDADIPGYSTLIFEIQLLGIA